MMKWSGADDFNFGPLQRALTSGDPAIAASAKASCRALMAHPTFSPIDHIFVAGRMDDAAWFMELYAASFAAPDDPPPLVIDVFFWSACACGLVDVALHLADLGADLNSWFGDARFQTPIIVAGLRGRGDVVRALAADGRDDYPVLADIMMAACYGGFADVVKDFMGAVNLSDPHCAYMTTPLNAALLGGHKEVVLLLLQAGVPVDYVPDHPAAGSSLSAALCLDVASDIGMYSAPITIAVRSELVLELLSRGVVVTGEDLSSAVKLGDAGVTQILLDAGGDAAIASFKKTVAQPRRAQLAEEFYTNVDAGSAAALLLHARLAAW